MLNPNPRSEISYEEIFKISKTRPLFEKVCFSCDSVHLKNNQRLALFHMSSINKLRYTVFLTLLTKYYHEDQDVMSTPSLEGGKEKKQNYIEPLTKKIR